MQQVKKDWHLGLRIDSESLYKLHYISAYHDRSSNAQLLKWVRQNILAFEKEHGKIQYPPEDEE